MALKDFACIDYGYAITTHKSQGSTYDICIMDLKDINGVDKFTSKVKTRLAYTAMTRPSKVLVIKSDHDNGETRSTEELFKSCPGKSNAQRKEEADIIKVPPVIENIESVKESLGGGEEADLEIKDTLTVLRKGLNFEESIALQPALFTKEEQDQIKQALNGKKLQVTSVSRRTDPAFFSEEIVNFLKENAKKPFTDPTRVNAVEI